ncbi:DUF6252 family protein [Flavobacterium sp.]|uniref:DUF6252 family protein n=1 Tax=Flavobacterium sp. TaxID=239 RepID=UPI0040332873
MKLLKLAGLSLLACALHSCSDDDSSSTGGTNNEPQYAMTVKINGTLYNMTAPLGGNNASQGGFSEYPDETHIHLQGWPVNLGIGAMEISLYLDRNNLIPGTYPIETDSSPDATFDADLIDNTNDEFESAVSGTITITEVDTTAKKIKGTFQFRTSDDPWVASPVINYDLTEGTFNYDYDQE